MPVKRNRLGMISRMVFMDGLLGWEQEQAITRQRRLNYQRSLHGWIVLSRFIFAMKFSRVRARKVRANRVSLPGQMFGLRMCHPQRIVGSAE